MNEGKKRSTFNSQLSTLNSQVADKNAQRPTLKDEETEKTNE